MEGTETSIQDFENANIPGIKLEIVKEEISVEQHLDLSEYLTVKDEVVTDKSDIELKQVHQTDSESQLATFEHSHEDPGKTEPFPLLEVKKEYEFEDFDLPDQIPVEDIDSILVENTDTKVKCEFGSTENLNERPDKVLEDDTASHSKKQPPSTKTLFKCEVCDKGHANEAFKNGHMRAHFKGGLVPCTVCGEEFDDRKRYVQHYGTHFEELYQFHCLICYQTFLSQTDLDEHCKSHHNVVPHLDPDDAPRATTKRYPCRYCSKHFPNRSDLFGHESHHNGKKLFTCPICLKNFGKAFELGKHRRVHTGSRPFSCEVCSKPFAQRGSLNVHLKIAHSSEKTFRCSLCPRDFAYNSSLQRHLRNHRGERPFKCKECFKSFATRYTLEEHEGIHQEARPFACTECPKQFRLRHSLKKHSRIHSSILAEMRPYQCSSCDRRFAKRESLKKHALCHDESRQFKCARCGNVFKNADSLKNHAATHDPAHVLERPFECRLCCRRFTTKYRKDKHVDAHPTEPFQCELCERRFEKKDNLRLHQRVHSEKRFACEACDKVFISSRNLKRHMEVHWEQGEGAV